MAGSQARLKALEQQEQQRRLSKEELLTPRQLEDEVFLESLGGMVKIRSLSHAQRNDVQAAGLKEDGSYDNDKVAMATIVACLIEPELTEADIAALREQDAAIIDELSVHIATMNLMGRAGDLKKGSKKTRS